MQYQPDGGCDDELLWRGVGVIPKSTNIFSTVPLFASESLLTIYITSVLLLGADPKLTKYSNAIGVLLLLVFVAEAAFRGVLGRLFVLAKPVWPLAAFVVLIAASSMFASNDNEHLITNLKVFSLFVIVYFIVVLSGRTWSMEFGLLFGLVYIWYNASWNVSLATERSRFYFDVGDEGGGALNPNIYAFYLCSYAFIAVWNIFVVFPEKTLRSTFDYVRVMIGAAGSSFAVYEVIVKSGSRKGQILVVLLLISVFSIVFKGGTRFSGRVTPKRLIVAVLLILCMGFGVYKTFTSTRHTERLITAIHWMQGKYVSEGSINHRSSLYGSALELWLERPVFGHGVQGFAKKNFLGVYSHSNVLEILANHGLLGFICFYSIHVGILWRTIVGFRRRYIVPSVFIWIVATLLSFTTFEIFAVMYYQKTFMCLLALLLAISYRAYHVGEIKHEWNQRRRTKTNSRRPLVAVQ